MTLHGEKETPRANPERTRRIETVHRENRPKAAENQGVSQSRREGEPMAQEGGEVPTAERFSSTVILTRWRYS